MKSIMLALVVFLFSCEVKKGDRPILSFPAVAKEPKVGEVWRWTRNENPFEVDEGKKPYYDYKVLAVEKGYVQYLNLVDSIVGSSTAHMFKVDAECISNCQ